MYKKYNFEPKTLSPLSVILEKLTPLLILAAVFSFLWK